MFYLRYRPSPPLNEFVDRFWLCSDVPAHAREQILPSGTSELVVNLRENEFRIYDPSHRDRYQKFRGAMVSGAYDKFFVIDPSQHASIAGVHFKVGAALPFLGVPAGELADAHVDLDILWGGSAAELRERLCAASTPAERFRVLEETLLDRFRPTRRHAGVAAAIEAFQRIPSPSVREVTRSVGLSDRRFIQLFVSEVGMTPKRYLRVRRFQRARRLASRGTKTDWPDVALACGYFDQSHLIRDFEEFSGLRPTEYLQRRAVRVLPNHVAADKVNFSNTPGSEADSLDSEVVMNRSKQNASHLPAGLLGLVALVLGGNMSYSAASPGQSSWAGPPAVQTTQPVQVRYQVKDVDRSIAFYTQILGFHQVQKAGSAFASVALGNLTLLS